MLGGLRQGRSVEELLAVVDEVGGVLEKANEAMRSLCMDLRPPVLHETGLGAALAWLAGEVKRTLAVELEVQSEPAAEPANEEQRTFLYQAAREVLLNTFKHAGVKSAQASLRRGEGNEIQLDVKDQGRGFDTTAVPAGGSGLFRLRESAEFFGGELKVRSAPGQGTCVTLTLPRA
jgi:signal transduction histidine kinase